MSLDIFREAWRRFVSYVIRRISTWIERKNVRYRVSNKPELDLLSPTENASAAYVESLKDGIDNPKVRNLAICGAYGSGKSSVIMTFQRLYPEYKCLNLSLANFSEDERNLNDKSGKDNENRSIAEINKLEYSLVQQFFYHVKSKDIPFSRYGRIKRLDRCKRWVYAILVSLVIASCLILWIPECLVIKGILDFTEPEYWLKLTSLIFISLATIFGIYKIIGYINNIQSAHFKAVDVEIQLQKDKNISILNRYLDELVYLFQVTDYQVVILEDLDRFERTSIFTKLRELNLLLNQAKDINRRIVFVYALKDDIFHSNQERTKFFDHIISIIPIVNSSNSAAFFLEKMASEIRCEENDKGLDKEVIMDLAPHISDMRSIKSIVADYMLYKKFLHEDIQMNNLLALLVYKTMDPVDFEKLYRGEGEIVKIVRNKSGIIKRITEEQKEELNHIEQQINKLDLEYIKNKSELESIIIVAYLKCIPDGYRPALNRSAVALSRVYTEDFVNNIIDENAGWIHPNGSHWGSKNITNEDLEKLLVEGFDYKERLSIITEYNDDKISTLKQKRQSIQKGLEHIHRLKINELCRLSPKILEQFTDNEFLRFLFVKGYIDENYAHYITVFEEGVLNASDNNYLMAIKHQSDIEDPFSENITDPDAILYFITEDDLVSDNMLNLELIHTIITSTDENGKPKYHHLKSALLAKLSSNTNKTIDFINRYSFTKYISDGLLHDICSCNEFLWDAVMRDHSLSNEARLNLFEKILIYASDIDIIAMNGSGGVNAYLSEQFYWDIFKNVEIKKSIFIIKQIEPKFKSLSTDNENRELLDNIYSNNLYELSFDNVKVILMVYEGITSEEIQGRIYTAIVNSSLDILQKRVEEEIEVFAHNVLCQNNNDTEAEENLVTLLNNSNIQLVDRKKIAKNSVTKISDTSLVESDEFVVYLLSETNCISVSQSNIEKYFIRFQLTDADATLIKFLNNHVDATRQMLSLMKESFDNTDIVTSLFLAKELDIAIYEELVKNIVFKDEYPIEFNTIDAYRIELAIVNGFITLSPQSYSQACLVKPQLGIMLLKTDTTSLVENIQNYVFSVDEVCAILDESDLKEIHQIVIEGLDIDEFSSVKFATIILHWYERTNSDLASEIFNKCISSVTDAFIIKTALTSAIKRGLINNANVFLHDYLKYLDGAYKTLEHTRKEFKMSYTQEDFELLTTIRNKLKLIQDLSIDQEKKMIKCKTRYRR